MSKTKSAKKEQRIRLYKGLPVVDAAKDLEICVTKRDVSMAKKKDPNNCAAAYSIRRAYEAEAEVHIGRTYIKHGDKWVRYMTPVSMSREITAFDRSADFEPGTYNLKAPPPTARLGMHRGRGGASGKNKGIRTPGKHHTVNIRESAVKER